MIAWITKCKEWISGKAIVVPIKKGHNPPPVKKIPRPEKASLRAPLPKNNKKPAK
jgi:hypothetical protein